MAELGSAAPTSGGVCLFQRAFLSVPLLCRKLLITRSALFLDSLTVGASV